jgi:hypothetical protein
MTSSGFEWPWRGPYKFRKMVGLALFVPGLAGSYLLPVSQAWGIAAFWALALGFALVLPVRYAWPWRMKHPVLTTTVVCWFLLDSALFLGLQIEGFRGPLLGVHRALSQGLVLFVVLSWGLIWFRRRRRPPAEPGPQEAVAARNPPSS